MEGSELTPIEQVRAALSRPHDFRQQHPAEDVVREAARVIGESRAMAAELRDLVFQNGIPLDTSFYECLQSVEARLGFSNAAGEIVGNIWAAALPDDSSAKQQSLFSQLLTAQNHQFFSALRALPSVIGMVYIPADFLIGWFIDLRVRVANDFAQGGFWRSLEVWAQSRPADALIGLELLTAHELDDDKVAIGAAILGNLRVAWERGTATDAGRKFETTLAQHADVTRRLVFHRSWINTGWVRGLSHAEFSACLNLMTPGVQAEQFEAFNFLRCLLPDRQTLPESVATGVEWLCQHSRSSLPDNSKHWVVNLAHRLAENAIADDIFLDRLWPLLTTVQPIARENQGTWTEIEHTLVNLLHKNRPQFERLLRLLVDANPDGLIEQFSSHGKFDYLSSEMTVHAGRAFYADLFFLPDRHRRQFAFALYGRLPFDVFPSGMLDTLSDDELALGLFEFQLHYLDPAHTRDFLMSVRERAERSSPQLVSLFRNELLYQAKNLPGAVLDGLKNWKEPSDLVRGVIAEAEAYFDAARTARGSAINSMDIPGWRRALTMKSRRQSREIEAKTEEHSVFAKLCSQSYLIYGTEGFRYCRDGEIGEVTPMKMFSTQIELPRLAMIDPEGAVIRHHHAIRSTNELATAIRSRKKSHDT